jgi:hypothetical protein
VGGAYLRAGKRSKCWERESAEHGRRSREARDIEVARVDKQARGSRGSTLTECSIALQIHVVIRVDNSTSRAVHLPDREAHMSTCNLCCS